MQGRIHRSLHERAIREDQRRGQFTSPHARTIRGAGAEHVCELNAVHPFLDRNGRTLRAFLQILADQAGHELDLARIDPQAWNQASIDGYYTQDYRPMCTINAGALVDRKHGEPNR
jgi:fido (protein-threonine AMPylation protein)